MDDVEFVESIYAAIAARDFVLASGASFDIPEVHRWTIRGRQGCRRPLLDDTPAMLAALVG